MVTCYHDHLVGEKQATRHYLDASASAFAHSIGHSSAGRINHGHEPNKAEVLGGKVDIVTVEGKPFGVLFLGHEEVAETWRVRRSPPCPPASHVLQPSSHLPPGSPFSAVMHT
uniref:Uncharacterized protein n=1 Tax=Podarcis muralis TaxID=64176 RepID=A0A670ILI8_PODMU